MKIRVSGRRAQSEKDILFSFTAAAAVANLAEEELQMFWIDLETQYKEVEITTALAPVKCTIDAFIYQEGAESWRQDCLEFLWSQ